MIHIVNPIKWDKLLIIVVLCVEKGKLRFQQQDMFKNEPVAFLQFSILFDGMLSWMGWSWIIQSMTGFL